MSEHIVWNKLDKSKYTEEGIKKYEKMFMDVLAILSQLDSFSVSERCDIFLNAIDTDLYELSDIIEFIRDGMEDK